MSEHNGTPDTLHDLEHQLHQIELEERVERARLNLARLQRQRKLAELSAQHAWPRQSSAGNQLLREHLTQRRDHQRELLEARQAGKDLVETSFLWDWVSGYQDLIDRLRSPDGLLLSAISIAADKKFGCYWPFFRTWNDLALLRGASRILYQTSALAQGAVEGLKSYIIGQGSQTRAVEKDGCPPGLRTAVQECLDEYSDRNQWPALEEELLQRDVVDGEWLLREFPQDDGCLLVRTVDSPQIIQPGQGSLQEWSFGIKNPIDPYDVQAVLAFAVSYDGDNSRHDEVPISEAHWHKSNTPRDVKRGLPDICYDVYDFLKVAGRLIVNMAEGSAIQAAIAQIRQWDGPVTSDTASSFVAADADYTETNPWTGATGQVRQVRPGAIEDIPKGMTYVPPPFSQGSPVYIQVEQAVLRAVAVRWNAPEWLTSGDASNNNYASSLTAESPFIKRCVRRQRCYEGHFTTARWRALRHRCESRGLTVNGRRYDFAELRQYIDIQVELPSPEVRDRAEEAQANSVRIQGGWKSRQTVAQEEGLDWETEQRNIEEYNEQMGQGQGLQLPGQDGSLPLGQDQGGQDQGDGNPFGDMEGVLEQALLEAGFTGVVTDKRGRKITYQNGKRVKGQQKPAAAKKTGKQDTAHPGAAHGSAVTVKPTKQRVFQGKPVEVKKPLTKQETGRVGEAIIIAWLKAQGKKDARPMNSSQTNFPIDALEDHSPTEIKAGLVSNSQGAQRWRLTFSQESTAEKEWYASATPAERSAWNAKKQERIHQRKEQIIKELEKATGKKVTPKTRTVIINPDTRTADIYEFDGFHDRIGWNSEAAQKAYKGSVQYGPA